MKSAMRKVVFAMGVASATIVASADVNTWVATSSGLASDGNNWSLGRAPIASDDIKFDSSSSFPCTWDDGAVSAVASWEQTADFTGTNTIATVYDGAFTVLTVAGNMTLNGGSLTHLANNNSQVYRLNLAIGGDLTVGANAIIDARAKGYAVGCYPEGGALGVHAGGNVATNVYGDVYHPIAIGAGNVKSDSGNNYFDYPGGGAVRLLVSGAVTMDGEIRVDSTNARWTGYIVSSKSNHAAGAAGSLWITAASMSGAGKIFASGNVLDYGARTGSGGRIAIELTQAENFDFDVANIFTYGTLGCFDTELKKSGCAGGGTLVIKTANQTYGTLYVSNNMRTDSIQNKSGYPEYCGYGISIQGVDGTTIIPSGENWTFDAICFNINGPAYNSSGVIIPGNGTLMIPEGASLTLPNGLASVSGGSLRGGILMNGGNLNLPEGTQTIQNNWVLSANVPFAINRDIIIRDGAAIGCLPILNRWDSPLLTDITINGNVSVDATGYLYANGCGFSSDIDLMPLRLVADPDPTKPQNRVYWYDEEVGGKFPFYSHGGQSGLYGYETNAVYGSIFSPVLPGTFGRWINKNYHTPNESTWKRGGGALKFTVSGMLTLDGKALSKGEGDWGTIGGSGGSINLTVGELSGNGYVDASGRGTGPNNEPRPNQCSADVLLMGAKTYTSGGRVSLRLTKEGATLPTGWKTRLRAYGQLKQGTGYNDPQYNSSATSAGTVYIQEAGVQEGHGTIIVDNRDTSVEMLSGADNWVQKYNTKSYTMLPSMKDGRAVDKLRNATLEVTDYGRVAIGADQLSLKTLILGNSTYGVQNKGSSSSQTPIRTGYVELNGKTLKVEKLIILGEEVPEGVYIAGTEKFNNAFSKTLKDWTNKNTPDETIKVIDDQSLSGGQVIVKKQTAFMIIVR